MLLNTGPELQASSIASSKSSGFNFTRSIFSRVSWFNLFRDSVNIILKDENALSIVTYKKYIKYSICYFLKALQFDI